MKLLDGYGNIDKNEVKDMPYGEYAECPRCGKRAFGKEEIKHLFGYRTMKDDKIIPQSHCRDCRSEEVRNSR